MNTLQNKKFLKIGEVASALGVSRSTLRRWADKGIFKVFRPYQKSARRFDAEEILKLIKSQN